MIGDPSFRDDQRKLLTMDTINDNIEGIKTIFQPHPDLWRRQDRRDPHGQQCRLADGSSTMSSSCAMSAGIFRSNRMLTFDSVKLRLDREQSLSFLNSTT